MKKLKNAFINEIRRLMTDPAGRGTDTTDTFSGNAVLTAFELTNDSLMHVDSVVVDGTTMTLVTDYTLDFGASDGPGTVVFTTAPSDDTDNIVVSYRYGTQWVYDDQPHATATMPRIAILNVGGEIETSGGVSDKVVFRHPAYRIGIWVRTGKTYTIGDYSYTGSKLLDYMISNLEDAIHTIRNDQTIGDLIDMKINSPVFVGLDEKYKLKRSESSVTMYFKKSYS